VLEGENGGKVQEVFRKGLVEGNPVEVLLDTGSARTLVRRELVPEGKVMEDRAVVVRCAHGEGVRYPLADVSVQIAGRTFTVRAGVSEHLPVQMLLGRDAPGLLSLLKEREQDDPDRVVSSELVAVTTRAQSRRVEAEEFGSQQKPPDQASTVAKDCVVDTHTETMGANFDDDMFEGGRTRDHLTKRQKQEG